MKIVTIGRGAIGGGLGRRWEKQGHTVVSLGRDGGDASDADVVLIAVPAPKISEALAKVSGLEGKVVIDATNPFGGRDDRFDSLAHEVKSITRGPVAKAFNACFAKTFDEIDAQRARPSLLFASDEAARNVTEVLIRDVGFDPVFVAGLESARALETFLMEVLVKTGLNFYRIGAPGQL
jgi:predicted dinucleotide-binding enzyme